MLASWQTSWLMQFVERGFAFLPVSPTQLLLMLAILFAAYIVFGISGFGTALIASPLFTLFLPLTQIIPLLALLDLFAASKNAWQGREHAQWQELKRLIPMMLIGSVLGANLLLQTNPQSLLLGFGLFVTVYGLLALYRSQQHPHQTQSPISTSLAYPFGLVGGLLSGLFGNGGVIYAIYLTHRLPSKDQLRITQTTLIGCATLVRAIIFITAGIYSDGKLLLLALCLSPAMLIGLAMGKRLHGQLNLRQFLRMIHLLVLLAGITLLLRYFLSR